MKKIFGLSSFTDNDICKNIAKEPKNGNGKGLTAHHQKWYNIYMNNRAIYIKSIAGLLAVLAIFSAMPANAATFSYDPFGKYSNGDMNGFVCDIIGSIGLGCFFSSSTQAQSTADAEPNATYTGVISRKYTNTKISLVRVPGSNQVYEIIKGQKHLIPTAEIFFDYGFTSEMIQNIDAYQLAKYPRAALVRAYNDKDKIYYLTEGGMLRFMPNKKVYESYGGREEDIIELSQKEFNYYPKVKYIYLAQPINRDVFLIDGNTKKYLTPMAVMRLDITTDQVTPVNQYEFDFYKTGSPIIY